MQIVENKSVIRYRAYVALSCCSSFTWSQHTYIRTYVYTHIHTYTHAHIYIHTYFHTYIYAYFWTYLHTYTFYIGLTCFEPGTAATKESDEKHKKCIELNKRMLFQPVAIESFGPVDNRLSYKTYCLGMRALEGPKRWSKMFLTIVLLVK